MNITVREIRAIVDIARNNPDLAGDDIVNAIIDGYVPKSGIQGFFDRMNYSFKRLVNDAPIITRPTTKEILKAVLKVHSYPESLVLSKTRKREIIRIRQQYILIAFLFRYTLEIVGEEIGKDHSTAIWHKNKALMFCNTEDSYYMEITSIIGNLPQFKTILLDRLNHHLKEISK